MAKNTDLSAILPQLAEPDARIRLKAVKALRNVGDVTAARPLAELIARETDDKVLGLATAALRNLRSDEVPSALAHALASGRLGKLDQLACAKTLGEYPEHAGALEGLLWILASGSGWARSAAALSLAEFEDPRAAEAVSKAFLDGAIKPPTKAGQNVAAARTLDLFVGDDAVRGAFASAIGPTDRILAAVRLGMTMGVEGGLVAVQDRLIAAARKANKVGWMPKDKVNFFVDWRFEDIDDWYYEGTGVVFRNGDVTADFPNLQSWLWDQWRPHITRITGLIDQARQTVGESDSD